MSGDFDRLLDIIMPSTNGLIAVLEAYLDESEQDGIFSVAGFLFRKERVAGFTKEWSALMAPYGFAHMTDLHARQDQFDGIDDGEADRLCTSQVQIINSRVAFGVAVGCSVSEIDACIPKKVDGHRVIGLGSHYPFCCHMAMFAVGHFLKARRIKENVAYVFESGNEYQGDAHAFMGDMTPKLESAYRHRSHAFAKKQDAVPLQAADVFAWEYARYWNLTVKHRRIPMRKSLASILTSGYTTKEVAKRFSINFFTGAPLWCAMEKLSWGIKDQLAGDEKN